MSKAEEDCGVVCPEEMRKKKVCVNIKYWMVMINRVLSTTLLT